MRRRPPLLAAATLATACSVALAGCTGDSAPPPQPTPTKPVTVAGSVVSTAGSSNEMEVVVPDAVKTAWVGLGAKGSGVEWIGVGGDGKTVTAAADLTGDTDAGITALTEKINQFDAQVPGRSALAGLSALKSPAGSPVWVFSPLLDTRKPLDFAELAFDESPATASKAVRKAGRLPKVKGREVSFVVTPVAGEQEQLSRLQVGYQHAVWEGLARAGGAKRVTFYDGSGATPGAGTIPAIPIPDPNDKINAKKSGKITTCTLPTPALFVSDQATLIDKKATLKSLQTCLDSVNSSTKITVEGHTAGVPGADNAFTKSLSTRRATVVAALLKELGVPGKNITKVVGYGNREPLVRPASSPKNRAVVVTFTSTK